MAYPTGQDAEMVGGPKAEVSASAPSTKPVPPSAAWDGTDRIVHRAASLPGVAGVGLLVVLLGGIWLVVQATGGTKYAMPHLFYIPIILGAMLFGLRGAVPVALLATILCGPLLLVDTSTGETQRLTSWLLRGAIFVAVGAFTCWALAMRERLHDQHVSTELLGAIGPSAPEQPAPDPGLVAQMPGILERQAFHPVFQPIYSLTTGELLSVEALTRFEVEPYRTPDVCFAAAAAAGVGTELEIAAIRVALSAAEGNLPEHVALSVNASPTTLTDPRFFDLVTVSARRAMIVEVTEHAVIGDYGALEVELAPLRAAGVAIAVDDAGAGFSSLRHIVQLAPDVIKLDISLTQNLGASTVRSSLGAAMVDFAHSTGARLVVEGIEDHEDLKIWAGLGVDSVQGYLVGRPGSLPCAGSSDIITALLDSAPRRGRGPEVPHVPQQRGTSPVADGVERERSAQG